MKKFALILIVMLVGLIIFNIATIDYSDSLTSEPNQHVYMRLVANALVLISLVLSYIRYSKNTQDKH